MYPSEAMVNIWLAEELQGTLACQEEKSLDTKPRIPRPSGMRKSRVRLQNVHVRYSASPAWRWKLSDKPLA